MDTQACTACDQILPATSEYFYWLKAKQRLDTQCKECKKAKVREYNKANAAAISERNKESYAQNPEPAKNRAKEWRENNPERKKQNDKDYAQKHPERRQAIQKRYLERHPERRKLTTKKYRDRNSHKHTIWSRGWRKRNPHIVRSIKLRRRAREAELPATLTDRDWQRALEHFEGKCAVCGRPPGLWHTLAADHWIPVTKGGGSTADNIVPLCHGQGGCNNSKGNRNAYQWLVDNYGKRMASVINERIESYLKGSP